MKIKESNEKLVVMFTQLEQLVNIVYQHDMYDDHKDSRAKWQRFVFAVSRNIDTLESINKAIQKAVMPSDKYREFVNKRSELARKYSDKDDNNKPLVSNNNYVITKNTALFESEVSELTNDYEDAIIETNKLNDTAKELMGLEQEIEMIEIPKECLPLTLTISQVRSVMPLVTE